MLQAAAIITSGIWPLSTLSRSIYRSAIRAFGQLCSGYPEIEAAYVRNTFANREWIAGSSDIDLTIILGSDLSRQVEFQFLTVFGKSYSNLVRRFPMIGELEVLSERELPAFQSCCVPTRGDLVPALNPFLVYGRDIMSQSAMSVPPRSGIRALNDALWLYQEQFLPSLAPPRTFLRRHFSARLGRKVFRLCTMDSGRLAANPKDLLLKDSELLVARVHHAMERTAKLLMAGETQEFDRNHTPPMGPFFPVRSANVESVCTNYEGRAFVILKDNLDLNAFANAVCFDQPFWCTLKQRPVFLSRSLAIYYLRFAQPFYLAGLRRAGTIAFGANFLAQIPEPTDEALRGALLDQVRNAILTSRDICLFQTDGTVDTTDLELILQRLTLTLMAVRGPLASRSYDNLIALSESQYPEEYKTIERIRSLTSEQRPWEAFFLFRSIIDSIVQAMPTIN